MDQHQLDILARQHGFPDYATYAAWSQKRAQGNRSIDASKVTQTGPAQVQKPSRKSNWLSYIMSHIPPFTLIGNADDAFGKATGTGR